MTDHHATASPSDEHVEAAHEIAAALHGFESGTGLRFQLHPCSFGAKALDLVLVDTKTGASVEIFHPLGQNRHG